MLPVPCRMDQRARSTVADGGMCKIKEPSFAARAPSPVPTRPPGRFHTTREMSPVWMWEGVSTPTLTNAS